MDTEVTFPKVTLCHDGVRWQERASITAHLHLYIGLDRGFPDRRLIFPAKSSVDILSLCRAINSKVADYPRSFTRRGFPHSITTVRPGLAFVSICNSKMPIPLLPVTDRDVSPASHRLSKSVTDRTVFCPLVLQNETFPNQHDSTFRSITDRREMPILMLLIKSGEMADFCPRPST